VGTVPMGVVEWSMMAWRHSLRLPPVERSMRVSAPYFWAQLSFSTSSWVPEETGEAPMLALILVVTIRPMAMGSRRLGAWRPLEWLGSLMKWVRWETVWLTQRLAASLRAPGWPSFLI